MVNTKVTTVVTCENGTTMKKCLILLTKTCIHPAWCAADGCWFNQSLTRIVDCALHHISSPSGLFRLHSSVQSKSIYEGERWPGLKYDWHMSWPHTLT
jgi:hypothetical protein